MFFDPNNAVIHLCALGMQKENELQLAEAKLLFLQAWQKSTSDFEKSIAAHYVARHQESISDKLKWDELALNLSLKSDNTELKAHLPSLYLNIGKCHEDLEDYGLARETYNLANEYVRFLPDNGYGQMIKSGIKAGLLRLDALI